MPPQNSGYFLIVFTSTFKNFASSSGLRTLPYFFSRSFAVTKESIILPLMVVIIQPISSVPGGYVWQTPGWEFRKRLIKKSMYFVDYTFTLSADFKKLSTTIQ